MTISPNPATDRITIQSPTLADRMDYSLTVFDATGREALRRKNTADINLGNLPPGVYTLMLKAGGKVETERFVRR